MAQERRSEDLPSGLRVLVVDDDPLCLMIVEKMLRRCSYTVTTCNRAVKAMDMLREDKSRFDIVLSDVYMPDMDGFRLLEMIGLELDIPVISTSGTGRLLPGTGVVGTRVLTVVADVFFPSNVLIVMSANGETSVVLRGITHGAVDYLLKPVRIEELRNIWQHVVRKKQTQPHLSDERDEESKEDKGSGGKDGKRKCKGQEEVEGGTSKKPRVVWTVELHQQFVNAVNQLGIEKAVPKRILDLMNVQGLTRENVASHLQKYRLYLKRLSGSNQLGPGSDQSHYGMMAQGMGHMIPGQHGGMAMRPVGHGGMGIVQQGQVVHGQPVGPPYHAMGRAGSAGPSPATVGVPGGGLHTAHSGMYSGQPAQYMGVQSSYPQSMQMDVRAPMDNTMHPGEHGPHMQYQQHQQAGGDGGIGGYDMELSGVDGSDQLDDILSVFLKDNEGSEDS